MPQSSVVIRNETIKILGSILKRFQNDQKRFYELLSDPF